MSNTINTNFKADVTSYGDSSSADMDVAKRVEDAIREIEDFKAQYGGYLNEENYREMERIETMLKAEMAAMEGYGRGGDGVGGADGTQGADNYEKPTDLVAGWNVSEGATIRTTQNAEDAALCDGEYQGTVNFEGSKIGFSVQDAAIQRLDVKSAGKDLVFTVTYEDGTKKSWVLTDGSVRSEGIIIDATLMSHGITIDASEAVRISDGKHDVAYGKPIGGLQIWGTGGDDEIWGSQGWDFVAGLAGNDKIDGQAGNDMLYGDDKYDMAGGYAATVDGGTAGDDDIRGGTGTDTIYGGAGIDTGYSSDALPDKVADMGGEIVDDISDAPDPDEYGWLGDTTGWSWEPDDDGSIVLRKTGTAGGKIDIDMDNLPEGYNMAFAHKDTDGALVITFVGQDASGNPTSFDMKIEGFYDDVTGMSGADAVVTLNITGTEGNDVIDFSQITDLKNQNVNIYGGAGNDIILGVEAKMLKDGIDFDNWWTSTARGDANRAKDDMFYYDSTDSETWDHWTTEFDETTGQIIIKDDGTYDGDPTTERTCTIVAPEGYDHGYITIGEDGYTYAILVNGDGETIVIKFEDTSLNVNNINIMDRHHETAEEGEELIGASPIDIIPVTFERDMYTLDGGDGDDMIFGIKGSTFVPDPLGGDYVVKAEPTKAATSITKHESEEPAADPADPADPTP